MKSGLVAFCLSLILATQVMAEDFRSQKPLMLIGRQSATVTTSKVRLSDLAEVTGRSMAEDDAVITLKKIEIANSPKPGQSSTISAAQILERLQSAGANLADIGYTFPRVITVSKASRTITEEEVRAAIEHSIKQSGREATIKSVSMPGEIQISTGALQLLATELGSKGPGRRAYGVDVVIDGVAEQKITVETSLDEWTEIPVASRTIPRGTVVEDGDLMMARLNTAQLPQDTRSTQEKIVGLEASGTIAAGDVFRANRLVIPPVITSGSRVTMRYQAGPLQITASGTALEDGAQGKSIRVRNEDSKRIINATVIEAGIVGVKP